MNFFRAVGLVGALCGATPCAFGDTAQTEALCAAPDSDSLALLQRGLRLRAESKSLRQNASVSESKALSAALPRNDAENRSKIIKSEKIIKMRSGPAPADESTLLAPPTDAEKRRAAHPILTDIADRIAADAVMVNLFTRRSRSLFLWTPMIFLTIFTWAMLYLWGSRFLGRAASATIERIDQGLLGVDIDIEDTDVQLWFGRIDLLNVTVNNPPGFQSEYLLKAHRITIDLDVLALICSLGRKIVIEELTLDTIDAIIEYDGYVYGTSNVQKVVDFLEKSEEKPDDPAAPAAAPAAAAASTPAAQGAAEAPKEPEASHAEVQMKKVAVLDIGIKASTKLGAVSGAWMHSEGGVAGIRASVADIEFENFTEEFGAKSTGEIVLFLLTVVCKSALKTSVANIAGKETADKKF